MRFLLGLFLVAFLSVLFVESTAVAEEAPPSIETMRDRMVGYWRETFSEKNVREQLLDRLRKRTVRENGETRPLNEEELQAELSKALPKMLEKSKVRSEAILLNFSGDGISRKLIDPKHADRMDNTPGQDWQWKIDRAQGHWQLEFIDERRTTKMPLQSSGQDHIAFGRLDADGTFVTLIDLGRVVDPPDWASQLLKSLATEADAPSEE